MSLETRFWLKFFFRHFLEISRNWMAKMATGPGPNQTLQTRLIYKIFRSKLVHVGKCNLEFFVGNPNRINLFYSAKKGCSYFSRPRDSILSSPKLKILENFNR